MNYIQNLTEFRKKNGISQNKLAELLQTTQQQISKYENGKQEIPVRHLIKIADTYNVSIDYLIGRKQEENVITDDIKNLISSWYILSERNKGKVELLIEQLIESQSELKEII